MKKSFLLILFSASMLIVGCISKSDSNFPVLKGDYLGQKLLSEKAEIFAPGIISTGMYERDIAVSTDGNEIYYTLFMGDWNTIMFTQRVKGIWSEPVVASFARDTLFFFAEPALSADGNKIFYLSTKPRENEVAKPGWNNQNIWFAQRKDDGSWSEGTPLPNNINTHDEFYPSLTSDGSLYFCRTDDETGGSQILRSKFENGIYCDPEILPHPVNGTGNHFNAFIAPDNSYLVGCVAGRDSLNPHMATYMLFFHNSDDTWTEGIDLIKELDLPCSNAISISLSPDGKYLFFASTNRIIRFQDIEPHWSLSGLRRRRVVHGNGNSDIYWLKFDEILARLRTR
jgi:hypothetical protein